MDDGSSAGAKLSLNRRHDAMAAAQQFMFYPAAGVVNQRWLQVTKKHTSLFAVSSRLSLIARRVAAPMELL
jgi:hypothetical protein